MSNALRLLPAVLFVLLVGLLWWGLGNDPREIPSPFINKAAPQFTLPQLYEPEKTASPADLKGKVWILNVWASWCVSCRAEHEVVSNFVKKSGVDVLGLNYKDFGTEDYGDAAKQWLQQFGNPYSVIAVDASGRTGIDWGVYGVPESFVVDKKGIIRHKFTGPIKQKDVDEILDPLIKKLRAEGAS
jgi:cytochrome c biogenesis protein CcmG/thiol:disulfide interchange protein DsbE